MNSTIVHGDALAELGKLSAEAVDLTVFSPPYDGLRDYHGFNCNLSGLGKELYRVTKEGGVVCMVMQDQTIDGGKTLTTFRTILDWCDNAGWKLFECCLYARHGKEGAWWSKRFRVDHEYMPIFVKGQKPKSFDKVPVKVPSKHAGKTMRGGANRDKNGETTRSSQMTINPTKCRGTIWDYSNGGDKIRAKREHPAAYPDRIPYDLIQVFSKPGDLVLDPMVGSGSTAVAADILQRKYLGIDTSAEYCALARRRLSERLTNLPTQED